MIIDLDTLERQLLPAVEKPGRYAGGELGSVVKDWQSAPARLAFAFPDTYELGMSHLGLRLLYDTVNRYSPHLCERVFMPGDDLAALLRERGWPLFTLESRRSLAEFDVIGFTLQYELSYTNILAMLDLAKLPLTRLERDESAPLIIAGGPSAYNPEPLAEIIDLFVIGEAEQSLLELLDLAAAVKQRGGGRSELLREAAGLEGIYVPSFYRAEYDGQGRFAALKIREDAQETAPPLIKKRIVADFDAAPFPEAPLLPAVQPVHDRIMLEIMRGCTRGCRFCQAGMIYRPVREKSLDTLLEQAGTQELNSGYDDMALLSLSSADYSCIEGLMEGLLKEHAPRGVGVSLPSLRVDAFSVGLAARTQEVRKSGITLAPEAGSQRLRDTVNKGVLEAEILEAAAAAFSQGYTHIKLYFMIGLPMETDSDIEAIAALTNRILQLGRKNKPPEIKKPLKISLGVSSFVPKSHTPFQWQPQNSSEELKRKQELLREKLRPLRAVSVSFHDRESSLLEAAFARGDRRLNQVLLDAYRLGCHADGWSEHFRPDLWRRAFAGQGLGQEQFAEREILFGEPLAWGHIDCGVSPEWLWRENIRAGRAELTPCCRDGECSACGVCNQEWQNRLQRPVQAQAVAKRRALPGAEPPPVLYKYRCRLAISGPMVWLSHLDLLSAMERALRRSGLPAAYSQGFNPHLLISWGPAHPVGLACLSEYADICFTRPLEEGWQDRLSRALPPGLLLLRGREVELSAPPLMAAINLAGYLLALPQDGDHNALESAVEALRRADSLPVRRSSPKGSKTVDLRPALTKAALTEEGLAYEVRLDKGAAARPLEIAELLRPGWRPGRMIRTGLYIVDGQGKITEP